jgi:hypothetical protein
MFAIRSFWDRPVAFLTVVAWDLALGVVMDISDMHFLRTNGIAAAMELVWIGIGWGMIGLVTAAIFEPKWIGPLGAFNLGAVSGLSVTTLAVIGIALGI